MTGLWRWVAVAVACAAPAQLALAVLGPGVRRAVGGRLVQLGIAAVAWCAGAVLIAAAAPAGASVWEYLLLAMAAGGAVLFAYVHWAPLRVRLTVGATHRQLDAHDRTARLAPGTLSFARGLAALGDRYYYVREFAAHGPVFRMSQFGTPTLCVLGLERRQEIVRQHGRALGPAPLPFARSVLRGFLRYMDDSTHNRYGPLMRRAMLGDTPVVLQQRLHDRLRERLQQACDHGASGPHRVTAFVEPMIREALDLLLFGFDAAAHAPDSAAAAAARRFRDDAVALYAVGTSQRLGTVEEQLLARMVAQLREQERALHEAGLEQQVALGRLRALDAAQPDLTALQNLVFMHRIATNNVSALVTWLLVFWAEQPEIVARVRDAHGEARRFLLERFLAETLRLSQSEYTYRCVTSPFVHDGILFPAGWLVRFCVWESHRDASVFDDPTTFRLRLGERDFEKARYAPFGTGRHACNGAELNELLCVTLLSVLADEVDVYVQQVEPLQRAPRHWGHWQPNAGLQVRLTHRSRV